ncbi:1,4-beta-xylanase [Amycolatopsis sp. WAC 01376]|uniref:endo-1,4-beta-xylanase n=1 Tax=Amycolatopsis sp. WAC 01376 TaxID=2203195 RepID=UPI000F77BD75|nr:endo-1,4-beta-xylanase [Amycolatopsis sp. WAC 01376]RSM59301.1 1,4-beta-xylanase [Amycolatopsis sp. WAC 01376]
MKAFSATVAVLAGVALLQAPPASAAGPLKDITNRYVGSAVAANHLANEADYRSVLTREFDNVTPENEMKWGVVEANRGQYNWSGADAIVDYAQRNGKSVRGHTLVWHSQLPGWVNNLGAGELRSVTQRHIATEMGRYRGKIRAWDVVNEMFNDDGTRRSSVFQQKLGDGYVADAFRWARAADPSAKLYINDYNTEGLNAKSDALYKLVRTLKQQGVPIDGVGFQAHLATQYGFPGGYQANLARFAALDVDVAITEADVRIPMPADTTKLNTQASYFKQLWDGCHAVARCVEFTTWGFTDRHSWVPDTFPGQGAACLFDSNLRPKPAYGRINP